MNVDINKKNKIAFEEIRKQLRKHTLQLINVVIIMILNANDYSLLN